MHKVLTFLENNEKRVLLMLTLVTFLLRLTFALISYFKYGVTDTEYIYWGQQFAEGHWVEPKELTSEMIVAPFLPVLVTLCIKLFSDFAIPLYVYNALITSLVVPVFYYIARELFNKETAWMISLWGVFFPEFFKYSPFILKESTIFFLLPLTLLFLIRSVNNPHKVKNIIYAALSFSILIHADERYVFFLPVLALIFLLSNPFRLVVLLKSWAIWFGIVVLLSIPWGVRNYLVYDQIVILSPRTTAITSRLWGEKITRLDFSSYENVLERNKEKYGKRFEQYYNEKDITPKEVTKGVVKIKAFFNFWQPAYFKPQFITYGYRLQKWSEVHNIASIVFYGIFLPFYLIGFILLIKKKHILGVFLATIPIIHSVLHAYMVSPLERYRSPVTFIIVMTGLWVILGILKSFPSRSFKPDHKIESVNEVLR